ncbi:MAG: DUF4335 domain-containing protein [Spirulinaceae cyanobacterium]
MNTIRRQYNLPNCQLILEGLVDANADSSQVSGRPVLSTLINAECRFTGVEMVLSGGRSFLDNLIAVVSAYAQEFLSGVYHSEAHPEEGSAIAFEKTDVPDRHRLLWYPETEAQGGVATEARAIELTTVQLYDLVEAIDQLLTDNRTLPDLSLDLAPVSRRYRQADVPMTQRLAPAVVGLSSLAIAAGIFYLIPTPQEIEPPQARAEEIRDEEESPEGTETDSDTDIETPDPEVSEDPDETPLSSAELATLLADAPQIEDATELSYLERELYRQLDRNWEGRSAVDRDLEYRVAVGRDGAILSYEPISGTSEVSDRQTPLPELAYTPTSVSQPEQIADFRVVFTDNAVLEVSPWFGYQGTPTLGPEIEESSTLRRLNTELYNTLIEEWTETPTHQRALRFRVGVLEDGTIADYQAQNQAAADFFDQTPLPDLTDPEAAGIGDGSLVPKEPLAQFDVVFRPNKVLEVSPHRGF